MEIMAIKSNIEKRGSKIIDASISFNNDVKELLSIIETINNVWQDDTSLSYINNLRDVHIANLSEFAIFLEDYGDYLKKVSQAYDVFDETFASKNIEV